MSDAPSSPCLAEVIDLDAEVTPSDFDPSISEDERRFYTKAYPSLQLVCDRKVHCTICKMHIGTAPAQESLIKMHPVLRVTHCTKCHDFYNSGEFSKGEDGSELYCRWCGQGGEVYCCSNCPYVFCKSCIVKNLSRGVVADIEQNENWSCFNCAPKILWPLRAQHWALVKYIDKQKKKLASMGLSEAELKHEMMKDRSTCCRLAKSKSNNLSDSAESVDSISRRSLSAASSSSTGKKAQIIVSRSESPAAKRSKQSNDEVVCTPDLLSMLEPDCQITVSPKPPPSHAPMASSPKVMSIHSPGVYSGNNPMQTSTPKNTPPPLVLRNTSVQMRQNAASSPVVRRTVVGSRASGSGSAAPVYHTINGYRIDLNTAAQQETFRLPNGKLIQVKRQGSSNNTSPSPVQPVPTPPQPHNSWQRNVHVQHATRPVQITPAPGLQPYSQINVQPPHHPQMLQYQNAAMSNTTVTSLQNGSPAPIHFINGGLGATAQQLPPQPSPQLGAVRPLMVRVAYPDTPFGHSRTQLQDQVFNTMEICLHLTSKVQTLTNSNAYKQARNYMDVKELYIHLSYLLTYAIGRFKGLQDKCLVDMRQLGFSNDADSLENGQLAAGVDYVRYGQLDDVELFSAGCNSFHNQVYEYRKSLLENLENDGESREEFPLSPLLQIGSCFTDNDTDNEADTETEKPNDDDDDGKTNPNDLKRPPTVEETDSRESAKERRATEHQHSSQMEQRKQQEPSQSSSLLRPAEETADYSQEFEGDDDYDMSRPGGGGGADEGECDGGGGEVSRRETESRAIDHKLIRLIELYPSIWCSRYPDYGNYEVTRVYWNRIAAQFKPEENIKLRWKNIRKRFVRIEERLKSGKRFNGYYNKATNFLFNRNLAEQDWQKVDKGEAENAKRFPAEAGGDDWLKGIVDNTVPDVSLDNGENDGMDFRTSSIRPLEISSTDLKIINFVKCNPVLWRKTHDHAFQRVDEQTRKNLWTHLWKQIPASDCDELIDRWSYLYELYKTFRLKHIKDENTLANLEVKYSKYLATLHFLYKIDEDALKRENLIMMDCGNLDMLPDRDMKLQDMPDDREFVLALTRAVFKRTLLWNEKLKDYDDYLRREEMWAEIKRELKDFKHKQASDDEDNDIEIVEPKTDTITLDSDNEDDCYSSSVSNNNSVVQKPSQLSLALTASTAKKVNTQQHTAPLDRSAQEAEFLSNAQSFLASMLEIDMSEGDQNSAQASPSGGTSSSASANDAAQKKQPRKKTTNKPNPTLLKKQEILQRERLEEMKRNDMKLKMKCTIELKKAEEEYPFAKEMLDEEAAEQDLKSSDESNKKEDDVDEVEVLMVEEVSSDSSLEEDKPKTYAKSDRKKEQGDNKSVSNTSSVLNVKKAEVINRKVELVLAKKDNEAGNKKVEQVEVEIEVALAAEHNKKAQLTKESSNIQDKSKATAEASKTAENNQTQVEDLNKSGSSTDIEIIEMIVKEDDEEEDHAEEKRKDELISNELIAVNRISAIRSEGSEKLKLKSRSERSSPTPNRKIRTECGKSVYVTVESSSPSDEFIPNSEPDIDVDKEIAKLLNSKNREGDGNESAGKDVGAGSDLIDDINEIIKNANNSIV